MIEEAEDTVEVEQSELNRKASVAQCATESPIRYPQIADSKLEKTTLEFCSWSWGRRKRQHHGDVLPQGSNLRFN